MNYNISKQPVPMMSNLGKGKIHQDYALKSLKNAHKNLRFYAFPYSWSACGWFIIFVSGPNLEGVLWHKGQSCVRNWV